MKFQVGVGLASAALLGFVALTASATNGGGNAWGTQLADMKSTASASVGNGNGHAFGLMLADIKGKRSQGEDAENEDNDEGNAGKEHAFTSGSSGSSGSLGDVDMHSKGNHSGLRIADQSGDDQGEDEGNGGSSTPPGGVSGGVGGSPSVAAVPEPTAALLFAAGTGLVVIALRRSRA